MRLDYRPRVTVAFLVALTLHSHPIDDISLLVGSGGRGEPRIAARIEANETPAGLTGEDWSHIRRALEESRYQPSTARLGGPIVLTASNPQQAYRTTFRRDGIEIVPQGAGGSWRLSLLVTGYGYEGDVRAVQASVPRAAKERVEYRRGPLTEWYANRPEGLEQGFYIDGPDGRGAGPLVIAMAVDSDLDVSVNDDGAAFADRSGRPRVRYDGLKAWDADGVPLRTRTEAADRQLRLLVEAETARFPVTVDPTFVHEAELWGHGDPAGTDDARFGYSVSVSGDTVIVGAPSDLTGTGFVTGTADVFVRSGATWIHQQKLSAWDGQNSDNFGWSVSLSGNTAVVGAPLDDAPGANDAGSAYVFVRSGTTWAFQQKLVAADGGFDHRFGSSVSLSGDTVVVGAPFDTPPAGFRAGSAYVFVRSGTTWTQQQKLLASTGAGNDSFGRAVAVSADTVVVGAPFHEPAGNTDVGSAYAFVRTGTIWTEQQELVAPDGGPGDTFGSSVSIEGETAIVGAPFDDTAAGVDAGSAYVFLRSGTTWSPQQKLMASDAAAGDTLGASVSISVDTVAAGAPRADPAGTLDAGAVYVFVRSGTLWSEQQKLLASDLSSGDSFGFSVSLFGDTVVAGANLDDAPGGLVDAGSAYVFVRSGTSWMEQQKLLGLDSTAFDSFGDAVSVSGDTVIVGADRDDTPGGEDAGSAYVFVRAGTTWTEQQKLVVPDGSVAGRFGASVSISGDTAVVGSPFAAPGGRGAVYVFVRSGTLWTLQQKLTASDGMPGDYFGTSVSLSGETIVVGAAWDDTPAGMDTGSAYVFIRAGTVWTEQQKLLPSDGASKDYFGSSASVSGETVVVGAPERLYFDPGKAYVYVRTGTVWVQQQQLLASDGSSGDQFGFAVSLSAETIVVGAYGDNSSTGSAYAFVRSGTVWAEQQKLLAADGATEEEFGISVSVFGDTIVIGAERDNPGGAAYVFARSGPGWIQHQKLADPIANSEDYFGHAVAVSAEMVVVGEYYADTAGGGVDDGRGSAHVFRDVDPQADLGVTKTDGQTTAVPGQALTYTITASNAGPTAVKGARVIDIIPAVLQGAAWTCFASPGSSCTPAGSGNINEAVNLLAGGSVTYSLTATVADGATGTLVNTTTVSTAGAITDPNPFNNSATDIDVITPPADLGITKTDSADPVSPGDPLSYSLTIANLGPADATAVVVVDTLPSGIAFVSSTPGPPTCILAGATLTCALGSLTAGSSAGVTISTTVDATGGILVNTATVSGTETDPDPTNNSASASTAVGTRDGELSHGADSLQDLAAQPGPAVDEDVFRISQKPYSSYEVVVDATSGDIGGRAGPLLERIGPDGTTVLQGSSGTGTGPSRSLRWRNTAAVEVEGEAIRVRSAGCGTDCGTDDVYRIRAYETTYSVPRFNNAGTQITVLVLQNPTSYPIAGDVYFRIPSGALVAVEPFNLDAKGTLVRNTATIPGATGVSGTISVAHDGRYGDLSGKAVALEPATGFSFDSPLVPRLR